MDSYHLRPATEQDFDFMLDIKLDGLRPYIEQLWGFDYDEQRARFRDNFDAEESRIIVVGGVDAGSLTVSDGEDSVFLAAIYLAAGFRGRGIGSRIIADVVRDAERQGRAVSLRVLKPNRARHLYERLGFVCTGETETHYLMRREPGGSVEPA